MVGCASQEKTSKQAEIKAEEAKEEVDSEAQKLNKRNAYIDFNNALVQMDDTLYDYFSYVAYQEEYEVLQEYGSLVIFLGEMDCNRAYEALCEYVDAEPSLEIDTVFKDLQATYEEVFLILSDMSGENLISKQACDKNPDDSFYSEHYNICKANHEKLMAVYEQFVEKEDAFYAAIDKMTEGEDEERLEQLKAEGNMVYYNLLGALCTSEAILDNIYEQIGTMEEMTTLDKTELEGLVEELHTYIADFKVAYEKEGSGKANDTALNNVEYIGKLADQILANSEIDYTSLDNLEDYLGRVVDSYNANLF